MPLKRVPLASVVFAAIGLFVLFWLTNASSLRAQSSHADWEKAAGGKMSFDVSSVRLNTSGSNAANTNFPWTMGTEVPQTGGLFVATNWPLYQYIFFAYKPTSSQQTALLNALPKWTKTDHFDVQARANGDPTADQYRMMMQSLLAERFKLAMHIETHDTPVFALVLAKPGEVWTAIAASRRQSTVRRRSHRILRRHAVNNRRWFPESLRPSRAIAS